MKKYFILFLLSVNAFSQDSPPVDIQEVIPVEEKHYYTGINSIVTGWIGPWPIDQLNSIDNICEAIFEANGKPVRVKHLKLNEDGTLKCPAEKDLTRINNQNAIEADEVLIQSKLKDIKCGQRVKARLAIQNISKELSTGQKKSMAATYATIDSLLGAGSLNAAREEIEAVTPDGVLVKIGDKTAMILELDKCK